MGAEDMIDEAREYAREICDRVRSERGDDYVELTEEQFEQMVRQCLNVAILQRREIMSWARAQM